MPTNPIEYLWPGIIAAQAIHVAARLRIPDLLAAGRKAATELASDCGADPRSLERLMRALGTLDLFVREPDGRFRNNPQTELLRSDHPQSQRNAALFFPASFLWRPLGELHKSVLTGEPAFPRIFGQNFFEYLSAHPEDAAVFNSTMTHGTGGSAPALVAAYDFSKFDLVVDVGGGEGALLRSILAAAPRLRGVLFDLPQALARAPEVLQGEIAARCRIVAGDFFESVPEGGDAYTLKGIIHDWRDEDAAKILGNIRRVIRPGCALLLIESIVDSADSPPGIMELLMLVIGGCERTENEFRSLLRATGFELTRIVPLDWHSLIECHAV